MRKFHYITKISQKKQKWKNHMDRALDKNIITLQKMFWYLYYVNGLCLDHRHS